jgi:hypothetical protein
MTETQVATVRGVQLHVETLLDQARQAAGLTDFGDPWFKRPLSDLVDFINRESGLIAADAPPVQLLISNLADRLRLTDFIKRHPEVRDEKLDVAGVIIGLPRGGSTLLQRLLSSSPQLTSTRIWEMRFPIPEPGERPGESGTRIAKTQKVLDDMYAAWPEMKAMHPMTPTSYDEEILLIDRSLTSLMWMLYFHVPSYGRWMASLDHARAYEELKLWLQLLQFVTPEHRGKKWLLKSPHHLLSCGVRTLTQTFPGAKVLMTHRAMEKVIPSFGSNFATTMDRWSANFDQRRLGPQILDLFEVALKNLLAVRQQAPADQFIDVHYDDMMTDPIGGFRRAMELMNLKVGSADTQAASAWMSANPRDANPRHRYKAEDYGMTDEQIRTAFKFYTDALVR